MVLLINQNEYYLICMSNICVEICKRLNIKYDKKVFTNSSEDILHNQKEASNSSGNREIFFRLSCFALIDYTEQ